MDGLRPARCFTRRKTPRWTRIRLARLVERLEAHLDGLRVAGAEGLRIAEERYAEYPEAGELFVVRMLEAKSAISVKALDLERVRSYLVATLPGPGPAPEPGHSSV